jgi:hypothetical protein
VENKKNLMILFIFRVFSVLGGSGSGKKLFFLKTFAFIFCVSRGAGGDCLPALPWS